MNLCDPTIEIQLIWFRLTDPLSEECYLSGTLYNERTNV